MEKTDIISKLKKCGKNFVKLVYPHCYTCLNCDKEIFADGAFCADCQKLIQPIGDNYCACCGRKTTVAMQRCLSCKGDWQIDLARAPFVYSGTVKDLILKYKFADNRYIADFFVQNMLFTYYQFFPPVTAVCFVPTTNDVVFERGFNQSKLLAQKIAESLSVPLLDSFCKQPDAEHQAGLGKKSRQQNATRIYKLKDKTQIANGKILLVDDVLTTGATSGALSALLKKAGAEQVFLLTVASTFFDETPKISNEFDAFE